MDRRISIMASLLAAALLAGCKAERVQQAEALPVVRVFDVGASRPAGARYTGIIRARYESNLGFRVAGKIMERLVDPGDRVRRGQALMRLDETDFVLAAKAAHAAVEAARATALQAASDEARRHTLVRQGWVTQQVYEQNKAVADASAAQLVSALAQEKQANDQDTYAVLRADADGVVMDVPGEPGQVVAAGQAVVRLAHDGAREAEVYLPEGMEGTARGTAVAALYAKPDVRYPAKLRELSAMADPATRTYRARYVLGGEGGSAPLGATVTIDLQAAGAGARYDVPVAAVFDDGNGPAVWVVDPNGTVSRHSVSVASLGEELTSLSAGVKRGDRVVALGAHLLRPNERVEIATGALDTASR